VCLTEFDGEAPNMGKAMTRKRVEKCHMKETFLLHAINDVLSTDGFVL
jgi:hypothetical protein